MIQTLHTDRAITKLICSSGGNAGHSVATIGQALGIPVDVYVPTTTMRLMINKISSTGAKVTVAGNNWNEADAEARKSLEAEIGSQYIPPFDHPLIWEGHSSIVEELTTNMTKPPDTIICSVGGGGLLRGIQIGLERVGWLQTKILAVETEGAASFAAAKKAGKPTKIDKISTIATTLGALEVTGSTLESSIETISVVVSDESAVRACIQYADTYRQIVEPSCGASLSIVLLEELSEKYLKKDETIVVIVCGGSAVSLELLDKWKRQFISEN